MWSGAQISLSVCCHRIYKITSVGEDVKRGEAVDLRSCSFSNSLQMEPAFRTDSLFCLFAVLFERISGRLYG